MKVKFKETQYEVIEITENIMGDGADMLTLVLGTDDIQNVTEEVEDCKDIEITDGDNTKTYREYTDKQAISVADGKVTVVLSQPLSVKVMEYMETIKKQSEVIKEQEIMIKQLNLTQADQDDAINYLLMGE